MTKNWKKLADVCLIIHNLVASKKSYVLKKTDNYDILNMSRKLA